jgi:hypothetical protein
MIMKKINLLIIGFLSCISLMGQRNQISNIVDLHLPQSAIKLSGKDLKKLKDNNDKHPAIGRLDTLNEYYKINSFTLGLHGGQVKTSKYYLEETKKGYDNLFKIGDHPCTNCTTEIKKINNYSVLLIHQESKDFAYYAFFSVDNERGAAVNGILDYNKSIAGNKNKALKTINELLNSMKFK